MAGFQIEGMFSVKVRVTFPQVHVEKAVPCMEINCWLDIYSSYILLKQDDSEWRKDMIDVYYFI